MERNDSKNIATNVSNAIDSFMNHEQGIEGTKKILQTEMAKARTQMLHDIFTDVIDAHPGSATKCGKTIEFEVVPGHSMW
jgi:predicted lipoprotein